MSEVTKNIKFSAEHKQICQAVAEQLLWVSSTVVNVKILGNNHYPLLGKIDDILDTVADLNSRIDEYAALILEHELVNPENPPFNAGEV